ncbi:MarR family winged helix-turn-helix transcriptional regulator [Microbacterium sp.]|uniref:MarR family winged helix-turn-helix transcriptional regulator n=1 Tax=Microbacterium sp. TaxID=51671 RepID=UPI0028120021|nr:MarR family winged helix-turn-helix transcriptional regulator [Microbacterium sp.]
MTESRDPVAQIAEALARLRGAGRLGAPPWAGRSPWDAGSHAGHHRGGSERHGHGGPFGGPPHGGPLGRGAARLRLLEELAGAEGPRSVGALAAALGVDQPRASRLVQAAVEMGLARREADPSDARRTLVALTEQGRAIVDRSRGARSDAVSRALDGFSPAERDQLAALLTRLADAWPR